MADHRLRYLVEDSGQQKKLLSDLHKHFTLVKHQGQSFRLTYLDSYDWRIWLAGQVLEYRQPKGKKGNGVLRWRNLDDGEVLQDIPLHDCPVFASDIPQWLRPRPISKVLKVRALLQRAYSVLEVTPYDIVDKKQHTLCRLEIIEEVTVFANHHRGEKLPARLEIRPVKGRDSTLVELAARLKNSGLKKYGKDPFLRLLDASGRQVGDYSNKINSRFDAQEKTVNACRQILLSMMDTMNANEDGIQKDIDTEYLHDFRVSVRRSRSLLTSVKNVFPAEVIQPYKEMFSMLGKSTNLLRDMDVYLLAFDDYQSQLPESQQQDLEPLRDYLKSMRQVGYQQICDLLNSDDYLRPMKALRKYLQTEVPDSELPPTASVPIIETASRNIWKVYRKLIKEGDAITDESPPEMLHDMRKTAKKLRYLLEFFKTLYPEHEITAVVNRLKELQDFLGLYQDYCVQHDSLQHFEDDMAEGGSLDESARAAIEYLVENMARQQHEHRQHMLGPYSHFREKSTSQLFRQLFKTVT